MKYHFFLEGKIKSLVLLMCLAVINANSQYHSSVPDSLFEVHFNSPKKVVELGKGRYLLVFDKAFFGTLVVSSSQPQESAIVFHLGEKLNSDGHVDEKPGGTVRYQKVELEKLNSGKTLIELTPDKRNRGPNAILPPDTFGIVMPFRYVEIENLKVPIEEIKFYQKAFHYRFNDDASSFSSSDSVLNSIWDLCKHTIKATSFVGYYIDGDRERIPYEADAYINQLSHFCLDSDYSIARRTNLYFIDHPTWPTEWLLHTVMLYYQYYLYSGDLDLLRDNYEMLKERTLMELEGEDGLISSYSEKLTPEMKKKLGFENPNTKVRDIVDWPPAQKDTGWKLATEQGERDGYEMMPVNTVVNAFYYHNLVLMSKIAGLLGYEKDVRLFKQRARRTKKSINQKLFDKNRGVYVDGESSSHASLHANMFPLAFDLVAEKYKKSVISHVKSRGMACSVYGAQYLLEGLLKHGEQEYALDLITDTSHDRTWWNMLNIGSTMTLEAWDMKYKPNADWNHAWGTAPLNIITRYLWGIQPVTAGFENFQISPQLEGLNNSAIKVPSLNGTIQAEYESKGQRERYKITVPDSMKGHFVFVHKYKKVVFNGRRILKQRTLLKLNPGENIVELYKTK
ncbi:alpha-L-rhamnosidase-related protein [Thermophagus sp. OGC60D27]|uniref:alpha-L-rhamnosidase-related protein n=1 Tax=Thermophagus sp. OGC60D27 TaxID=3458415 RepID=UPI004037BAF8